MSGYTRKGVHKLWRKALENKEKKAAKMKRKISEGE